MDKEKAKLALKHLIDRYRFNKNLKDFISNEKQISRSLIEPFIRDVLGWDIDNPQEFKVEVPASGKRVDILVCFNGVTQFIMEAKSLNQDIVNNYEFYKQTLSYAHSKDKTFAVLTNFKHFIILRCDVEVDNPLKAAIKEVDIENCRDEDFDFLYNFSKQVWVEKGEENPLYSKLANFRKRAKVDVELLEDLKEWRQSIINNIKKHPRHNKYDFSNEKERYYIEEEIQRFIDRLIFVCYTEDKGFVDSELKSLIELKKDRYYASQSWLLHKIRTIFKKYWSEYNSDLFKFGKCDEFFIDDEIILKILIDLRKPKDKLPYDFGSIEADILGKTYENFIGHIISGEKRFEEKESRSKRKSEGIYYTPTYIVDYIVRNTVREYIKGKSFASINKVRILDPACGSGSFLIKAFDALVDECESIVKRKLNYEEKKNLMLNCIFGVDKDERAVDICKLNLSLKLAERGQRLPELHNNIKCGDSLIDDENIAGYKAFKWENEFKEIMQNGGFDVVVGNPPYVRADVDNKEYQKQRIWMENSGQYTTLYEKWDLYIAFIERGLKFLKNNGMFSFIVSNSFNTSKYSDKLKMHILNNYYLKQIDFFKNIEVFKGVGVESVIIFVQKSEDKEKKNRILHLNSFDNIIELKSISDINRIFRINAEIGFEEKFFKTELLGNICYLSIGMVLNANELTAKGEFRKDDLISNTKDHKHSKPYVEAENLKRYKVKKIKFLEWGTSRVPIKIRRPTFPELYNNVKLIRGRTTDAVFDDKNLLCNDGCILILPYYSLKGIENRNINNSIKKWSKKSREELQGISKKFDLKYLLAIINSKFAKFYLNSIRRHRIEYYFYPDDLKNLPVKNVSLNEQQPFINLCDKMLSLNKKLQEIGDKNTLEKQKLEQEIKKTDNEIDELVYQLYGITEEEKKIIEESLR